MTQYVVGYMFDNRMQVVALIRKSRPAWQRDRLNGIGGHVEPGESFDEAMRREFREETGVDWPLWIPFARLQGPSSDLMLYAAVTEKVYDVMTQTDEDVDVYPINDVLLGVRGDLIPNVQWSVAMAISPTMEFWPYLIQIRQLHEQNQQQQAA